MKKQARTKILLFMSHRPKILNGSLNEISIHDLPVSIKFLAFGGVGKTLSQSFILASKNAKLTEPPTKKTSNGKPVLKVKLAIPDARLIHSSYPGGKPVDEEW